MSQRLAFALEAGGLVLPDAGRILVLHPPDDLDFTALPRDRLGVVQPLQPAHDALTAAGIDTVPAPVAASVAIVCAPRSKSLARALVAAANDAAIQSATEPSGGSTDASGPLVVVDGPKVHGIDSLWREVRNRVAVTGPVAKAHGKTFWFTPEPGRFDDWREAPGHAQDDRAGPEGRFVTAPGVFSADRVDPGSALLAAALPAHLGRHVIDLGAGWGYLARQALADPGLDRLDLVEADLRALDCARQNIDDPRARFHWADARRWQSDAPADAVLANPPFHSGRDADPDLGRAFVTAAAGMLAPAGTLWLVANRHLPYETTLASAFRDVVELAGSPAYKLLRASRPVRARR